MLIGIKIAMTAPVQQQFANDAWKVNCVMPSEYTMDSLPKPNNEKVTLRQIDRKTFVVIRFAGRNSDSNLSKYEQQLREFVETQDISVKGSAKYAFYNPPWTLPFMRRNEVMLEVEGGSMADTDS